MVSTLNNSKFPGNGDFMKELMWKFDADYVTLNNSSL